MKKSWLIYTVVFVLAIIFSQSLYLKVSYVVFLFVIIIPPVSFLYAFIGTLSVDVQFQAARTTVEKLSAVPFAYQIKNKSVLPFPFVKVYFNMPDAKGSANLKSTAMLSILPFQVFKDSGEVIFRYRGKFPCGVEHLEVCDMFGLFRLPVKKSALVTMLVLPRVLTLETKNSLVNETEDSTFVSQKATAGYDEFTDIRSYQTGDSPKLIHWKLSLKSEELVVRNFQQTIGAKTHVIADLTGWFDSPEDNHYSVDGVVETAIALALQNVMVQDEFELIWYDKQDGGMIRRQVSGLDGFYALFHRFGTAEHFASGLAAHKLLELSDDINVLSESVYVITAYLTEDLVISLSQLSSLNHKNICLVFFDIGKRDFSALRGKIRDAGIMLYHIKNGDIVSCISKELIVS